MARTVVEWVGATDDSAIPDRVRVRVFIAKEGKCHRCRRLIRAGEKWVLEHVVALVNWIKTASQPHGNRESNLDLTCCNCILPKNAEDMAIKAEAARVRKKHILPKGPSRGFRKPPPGYNPWTRRIER